MATFVLWLGALCFGSVVGWITYRTVRRSEGGGLSDIATVIGAVGGAAVTALFPTDSGAFGAYCIGLSLGFFGYLVVATRAAKAEGKSVWEWLGGPPASRRSDESDPGLPPTA